MIAECAGAALPDDPQVKALMAKLSQGR